jgi:hypothetical protein
VEPVVKSVLERIAHEERSHTDFSWAVLDWLLSQHPDVVTPVIEDGLRRLRRSSRPGAVSVENHRLVDAANDADLRAHGRISDEECARLWDMRLADTKERIAERLERIREAALCG